MLPSRLLRFALVALAVIAVACGDPTRPKATYSNSLSSYTLYALTGTAATVPNAVSFLGGPTRASSTFGFDLAFDIDAAGRVQIYPVRTLAGSLAGGVKRVGLLPISGGFESIREVPERGYDTLSIQTVAPRTVLAVQILDTQACISSFYSQLLYAKLVIDSIDVPNRRLYIRSVTDLNCGYRMVNPDTVPTN